MYIKSIKFHFNTNVVSLKATGKEAQRVFDSGALQEKIVLVEVGEKLVYIPQSSILYTEVVPHKEANELKKEITDKFIDLKNQIKETHEQIYKDPFLLGKEVPINYYFSDLEYWHIMNDGGLDVGADEADADVIIYDEPIIEQYKEIMKLRKQLTDLVGEAK